MTPPTIVTIKSGAYRISAFEAGSASASKDSRESRATVILARPFTDGVMRDNSIRGYLTHEETRNLAAVLNALIGEWHE